MTAIQVLDRAPAPDWLRQRVYAGDLLIMPRCRPVQPLLEHFDAVVQGAFEPHAPPRAQFALDRAVWQAIADRLRSDGKRDQRARALMRDLFVAFGLDPASTAADAVNLRVQPHTDRPGVDPRHTLGAHRDTWASNVYQQINWWMPLYPVTPARTIAFFPGHWSEPVANDSGDWDLEAVRAEVRAARLQGRAPQIRNTPDPLETPAPSQAMPVVIEPGDVLIFSGAHLHASVPNDSGATRFSLELRSIDLTDAMAGTGAPNVDGAAPHTAWHWFRQLDSGVRLERGGPGAARRCDGE